MFKIVVVEDDRNTQFTIKKILREMDIFKDSSIKICYFTKLTNELKEIITDTSERKIYIMDIELETRVSGIDIAKFIRKTDWESEIIFTTHHDKMFETAYRNVYEVFDFIEKFHDFDKKLKKDIKLIINRNYDKRMFKYDSRDLSLRIFYRSITHIYRDKEARKIIINTDKTSYSLYLSITDCMKYLDSRFKIVHRACIANTERIQSYDWKNGCFELDNGKIVTMLSKKFKKELESYDECNN